MMNTRLEKSPQAACDKLIEAPLPEKKSGVFTASALVFMCSLFSALYAARGHSETILETIEVTPDDDNGYAVDHASTATRDDADLLDTPYSVSIIDNAILEDSYTLRLEDAAPFAAGVEQGSGQGGFNTDLIIRGYPTGGRVYLDGLLDNQKFQVRDMALVERIEILKGQSSVLYGSGAPGGTVNYIAKKPLALSHKRISLALGNYDFARGVIDNTGPLNADKTLLYRVIAAGQLSDDFRANVNNNRATLAPSLQWRYADHGTLDLSLEYSHETQPYRFDNVYTQGHVVYDRSYVDPRAQSDRAHWRVSMALAQQLYPDWSLQLSSQYFHVERHDLLFGFFTFIDPTTLSGYYRDIHDHYDQYTLRGELHGEVHTAFGDHHLIAGAERTEMDDRLNSLRNVGGFTLDVYDPDFNHPPPLGAPLDRDFHNIEYGYYLTDRLDLGPDWHLSGGLRYSEFNAKNTLNGVFGQLNKQHALTFNGGLSFTPVDWFAPYFGYSESFLPNDGIDRNQQFLPPQQGQQYEFGVKSRLSQRLNASAAVYRLKQHNLTQRDPSDPDFLIAAGATKSQGLELELTGALSDLLQVIANYSWIEAEFTQHPTQQGNIFRSTPKHSGALWLKYELPWQTIGRFDVGGGLVLVDRRQGDDANSFQVPGYIRADLSTGYHNGPVDVRLKIENLLDKRYVSASLFDDTVVQGNRLLVRGVVNFSFQ